MNRAVFCRPLLPFRQLGIFSRLSSKASIVDQQWPIDRIRNFGIVAHVDHGKSTLADRLMETTGLVAVSPSNKQILDQLPVERERGITVKAQTASMYYNRGEGNSTGGGGANKTHLLNLIDTPGHVDFSYEVSRSLAACDGVVLLVDAQQGVQAQTVANFLLAFEAGLSILPVINKIDLPKANISDTINQLNSAFGFEEEEILKVSAKLGTGVSDLLDSIINKIPSPKGDPNKPLRMLLFDSWYNQYRGVVCLVAVVDGTVTQGDIICSSYTGNKYEVMEVGVLQPDQVPQQALSTGQVGYIVSGMRSSKEAQIGDTLYHYSVGGAVQPLAGLAPAKPMVFAGLYPMDQSEYPVLRSSLERLTLNDNSVTVKPDSSSALGQGWRIGFLGLLHMEVFTQRLEEEFSTSVLVTTPSVSYKAEMKNGEVLLLLNPSEFPERSQVKQFLEPFVIGTLIFPDDYLGKILKLCQDRRGIQQELLYLDSSRVMLKYLLPLSEIVVDFFDQIKGLSSGYASFDYEDAGYKPSELVKLDILLNGHPVDALSCIVHADKAYNFGRSVCVKLKDTIHRQLFEVAIQASIGGRVIARETVKALRKDVTAKCYGGDITRKMKLLRKQKEGKRKLKRIGNVELSRDAFLSVLER